MEIIDHNFFRDNRGYLKKIYSSALIHKYPVLKNIKETFFSYSKPSFRFSNSFEIIFNELALNFMVCIFVIIFIVLGNILILATPKSPTRVIIGWE